MCGYAHWTWTKPKWPAPNNFLFELLTGHPNYVKHYSHLGFQSYATNPQKLETLDKLRFDFFRLGWLRESIEEAEPVLRSADIFAFDLSCVRFGDAPANRGGSPNGFSGEEACMLARFAGMSTHLDSFGIYEFHPQKDRGGMTAQLLAQMIWYFIDGLSLRRTESDLEQRAQFVEYPAVIAEQHTLFLKSRRTDRWWMQLPNGRFIPCSVADYRIAKAEGIPERWLPGAGAAGVRGYWGNHINPAGNLYCIYNGNSLNFKLCTLTGIKCSAKP